MKSYLLLAFSLFLIASCKLDKTSGTDNVLDIRMAKEPEKLNPVFFPNPTAREVFQYIFLPLAENDPITFQLVPVMIKAMPEAVEITEGPFKNGVRFTFDILDEARWDDGKPVTGEDYLYTLKAIMNPGTSASAYRSVISNFSEVMVDSINNKRVHVYYKKYYMLAQEAVLNVEVLPKHIYDPNGYMDKYKFTDFKDEKAAEALVAKDSALINYNKELNGIKYCKDIVIGSGPYRLAQWNANQQIVLEKKKNYWGANMKLRATQSNADKIIMHFIPDETAATTRLKNGEVDILGGLTSANYDALVKSDKDKFQFNTAQLMKYYSVLINHTDPILKSKQVRQALACVTNVDQYIATFENNNATRTVGPIHPTKRFYNKNIKPYSFDVEKSKILLASDGWKDTNNDGTVDKIINGKKMELVLPLFVSGDLGNNIALMLQSDAKKAGLGITINKKEFAQIRKENIEPGKFSMVLHVSSPDLGYDDLNSKFHSENAEPSESNQGFYKNDKIDALIDKINSIKDNQEREALYKEVQEIMHDDLPYIFLYSPKEKFIFSKKWKGSTNVKRPGYQANTFIAE
jgi:peptide/nickel transport system substrate-binding protein